MNLLRIGFLVLIGAFALSACTAFYHRQFEIIPTKSLSLEERKIVLAKYHEFMKLRGYTGVSRQVSSGEVIDYRIRDARSRLLPTSKISDTISTGIDTSGQLFIELIRISSYPPDDFSTDYLKGFVESTQKYLQESSGVELIVREVPRK